MKNAPIAFIQCVGMLLCLIPAFVAFVFGIIAAGAMMGALGGYLWIEGVRDEAHKARGLE